MLSISLIQIVCLILLSFIFFYYLGQENNPVSRDKYASKWRNHQRLHWNNSNDEASKSKRFTNNQKDDENTLQQLNKEGVITNGHHNHVKLDPHHTFNGNNRTSFYHKRTPFTERYANRNGNASEIETMETVKDLKTNEGDNKLSFRPNQIDQYYNSYNSNHQASSFRINRSSTFLVNRNSNGFINKRADYRNRNRYSNGNSNGMLSYRGPNRKFLPHSHYYTDTNHTNDNSDGSERNHIYRNANGFSKNACDDSSTCHEHANINSNQLHQEQQQSIQHQLSSFNEG